MPSDRPPIHGSVVAVDSLLRDKERVTPENRRLIREVWTYLRPYRRGLFISLALLILSIPFAQFHPLVWKYVVDVVLPEQSGNGLLLALGIMLIAHLVGSVASAGQEFFLEKSGQGFVRDLRAAAYERLARQSMKYHHQRHSGDLVTRVISDIDAMEQSVLRNLSSLLEEILTFVVVASIIIALQPVIGLTVMIPLAMAFVVIRHYNLRLKTVHAAIRKRLGRVGAFLSDRLGGVQLVQAFARQQAEAERFRKVVGAHYQSSLEAIRMRALFFPLVGLGGFISNILMLGLGAVFIWRGEFTLGGLIAYRGYWWRLQSPINTLARMTDVLQRARAAAERVMEVVREPVEIEDAPGAVDLAEGPLVLEFDHVEFSYTPGKPVLRGVGFTVQPGEQVALAGTSGAGKSTLLSMVPRFFDPDVGAVRIQGRDLKTYRLNSLRSRIGFVPQESWLFSGNIEENLRLARPEASMAEIEEACRKANATEFIARLPEGYQTGVGERGVKLSGGQKQRLSLARVFLADPPILLLDEVTSSVEPESQGQILQAIMEVSRHRTTLLATHQVQLLQRMPRILFLQHGKIIAEGRHEDLIENCPAYREAYHRWELEENRDLASSDHRP